MRTVSLFAIGLLSLVLLACGGGGESETQRRIPAPGTFVFTSATDLWIQDEDGARLLIAAEQDQQLLQPAISPDGSRVAYVVFQLTQAEGTTVGTDLAIADIDEPDPQIILEHTGRAEFVWNPRWTPDGQALILTHESPQSAIRILRLDFSTTTTEILRDDARDADISADGSLLVFVSGPYSGDPHLVVRDLRNGTETALDPQRQWRPRPFRIPRFSADGQSVIFSAGQYLPQVSAKPFATRPVPTSEPGPARPLTAMRRVNGPEDIWSYHLPSGELRQLAAIGEDQPDFTLSNDGRHILVFGAFGTYLISTSSSDPAYAIAPGEFHGWIDWIGNVSEEEWAEIRESVFEIPDTTQ